MQISSINKNLIQLPKSFYNSNKYENNNLINNQKPLKNTSDIVNINFQGGQKLIPITKDSLKKKTAQKLYYEIKKYIKLIGENGSVKDVKLPGLSEKAIANVSQYDYFSNDADIFLTINRNDKNTSIQVTRKFVGHSKGIVLLNAAFDKNGQMIQGSFPLENISFVRQKPNIRRMIQRGQQFSPIDGNDREWDCLGRRIPSDLTCMTYYDDSAGGAFELFIEFARLYTSIFK